MTLSDRGRTARALPRFATPLTLGGLEPFEGEDSMIRTATLLAVGLLLAGTTPAFAQHPMSPPAKSMHHQRLMQQQKPAVDSVKESSPTGRTPADIKNVERWLTHLKLYDGPEDGVMNPRVHEALKKFQKTHGIPVTGMLSDTVIVLLHKAAA
jgi:hypothetical protein